MVLSVNMLGPWNSRYVAHAWIQIFVCQEMLFGHVAVPTMAARSTISTMMICCIAVAVMDEINISQFPQWLRKHNI